MRVKPFETYQFLEGEQMTDRDKIEVGSKFWNKGKWDNFVLPLLPKDCNGLTLIELGCNAGLFLKLAEDIGFGTIIGIDSNQDVIAKGLAWRDSHKGNYKMICKRMENCIDDLPLADYTILVNTHYYFTINDWFDYLDKLQYKTRYVIIVTAEKKHKQHCWASADVVDIRRYFKNWDEVGFIDALPFGDDPMPRKLWSLCFKSRFIEKEAIDKVICPNKLQDGFCAELDKGIKYDETNYYRALKKYRTRWTEDKLRRWTLDRVAVFEDIKKNGLKKPMIINADNLILDGNHRYEVMKYLGYKNIFVRKV